MKLVSLQVNRSPLLRMLILMPVQAILSQDPQPVNYILIKLMLLSNSIILVSIEVGTKNFNRGRGRGRNFNNNKKDIQCQICLKWGHNAIKCYHHFNISFTAPIISSQPPQALIAELTASSPTEA
jgi:hypothetical protein